MASVIFDRDLRLRNIILEGNTLEITQVFQKEDPLWQLTIVSQFDRGLEDILTFNRGLWYIQEERQI
jgi:hypothetical protein